MIQRPRLDLLGRHVGNRPHDRPRLRELRERLFGFRCAALRVQGAREAEIEELDAPAGRHPDVRGLEVAVDDAFFVRRGERLGDLAGKGKNFFEWKGPGGDPPVEPLAFDELHDEEVTGRRGRGGGRNFFEGIDGGDSRMVECCEKPRFPLEPLPSLFTFKELFRQDLHGDVASEARVLGPIHLPHPSSPERREDLVGTETGAGGNCHEWRMRFYPGAVRPGRRSV